MSKVSAPFSMRPALAGVALAVVALCVGCSGSTRKATLVPTTATATGSDPVAGAGQQSGGQQGAGQQGGGQQGGQQGGDQQSGGGTPSATPEDGGGGGDFDRGQRADGALSPAQLDEGRRYVNGWDGVADEIPANSPYRVKSVGSGNAPAGAGGATPPPAGGGTGLTASWEGGIRQLITANCGGGTCHPPVAPAMGTFNDAKTNGAAIVAAVVAGRMPKAAPLKSADIELFKKWRDAGYPEKGGAPGAGAGAGGATPPAGGGTAPEANAGNPNVVEFRIPAAPGDWNTQASPVRAKRGQRLKVINGTNRAVTIHTNGAPFPHGNPIPAGREQEYELRQAFNGSLYEHGTGNDNTAPKLYIVVE